MKIKTFCASLFLCVQQVIAQDNYSITQPYDFPVKPGTQAWADLQGFEKILACEIPVATAKKMTTKALVDTCMNYPLNGHESAYQSAEAQDAFFNSFYGYKELAARPDAGAYLVNCYDFFSETVVKSKNPDLAMMSFMHWFLGRKEFLARFSPEQKEQLASLSFSNAVILSKSARNNDLMIFPARLGLRLLIEENVAIHKQGKVFDKTKLPAAALKYLRGQSIDKSEKNWCSIMAYNYDNNNF